MIDSYQFLDHLTARGLRFFSGVPDSVLSGLCAGMNNRLPATDHVVAPNEGAAIALGAGHYLATGTPAVIYLQNAGLGNIVNPVVSLVSPGVYGMPMLLIIGWRGETYDEDGTTAQLPDEPQHQVQGRITLGQLELMDIPYEVLDRGRQEWRKSVDRMIDRLRTDNGPAALVVRKDTFSKVALPKSAQAGAARLNREEAISCCLKSLPETVPVVATTGMVAWKNCSSCAPNGNKAIIGISFALERWGLLRRSQQASPSVSRIPGWPASTATGPCSCIWKAWPFAPAYPT